MDAEICKELNTSGQRRGPGDLFKYSQGDHFLQDAEAMAISGWYSVGDAYESTNCDGRVLLHDCLVLKDLFISRGFNFMSNVNVIKLHTIVLRRPLLVVCLICGQPFCPAQGAAALSPKHLLILGALLLWYPL